MRAVAAYLCLALALAAVAVGVSGAQVTVDAEKPRRRLRPVKVLKNIHRFKPVVVPKGDPRAATAPAAAAAAPVAVPATPTPTPTATPVPASAPAVVPAPVPVNVVVPSPPSTEAPQRPATPTAFWPAAAPVLNAPAGTVPQAVVDRAVAAAAVGPTRIYAATFETAAGMPIVSNDPNAVESDALLRRDKLEAKAVPNPTVVTVIAPPLPADRPLIAPGTGPLNPRPALGALKTGAPAAGAAATPAAAASSAPKQPIVPVTTRVLKLGATAGDNPCVRQGGQCQDSSTCGGIVTRLLCPGPPSITCCTYTTPECAAVGGACRDLGTCQGDMKAGLCGKEASIGCCVTGVAGWQGPLLPTKVGGNCLANFNAAAFVTRARKFLKDYTDEQQSADAIRAAEIAKSLGLEARVTSKEPASLITTVLDTLGWNCAFNAATGQSVASIVEVVKTRGGLHPYPKVGDVALWTADTGIVTDLCVGGRLDLITMSPAKAGAAPQTNMRSTGCVPLQTLATANAGSTFLGFWTPQ